MKRPFQSRAALAQQPNRDRHIPGPLDDLLTTEDIAAKLHYAAPRYFLEWANRKGIPRYRRGRRVLWRVHVVVAFLEGAAWTKQHAPTVEPFPVNRPRTSLPAKREHGKAVDGGVR